MIISDNFKLMHIIATQKIAHYSVNFDQIQKSFTLLVFNSCIVSGKNFKAIASLVVLVGVAKNCKRLFSDIYVEFLKSLQVTAARMIIHHSINFIRFKIPSKWSTSNRRIVSGENLKVICSVVFPVDMTKDFERFIVILSCITPLDSAQTSPNFRLR